MRIHQAPDSPAAGRLRDRAGRRVRVRTAALAEPVEWARGLGVDAAALRAAREEGVVRRVPALVRGSGTELPFKDECMDLVVCNHVDVWVVRK